MACGMATPVENQPQSTGLSSATLLDAINSDSELSDHDCDSDIQCKEDEEQLEQAKERGESNTERETSSTSSNSAVSLLDVLRAPRPSDLTRKRKCNAILENARKLNLLLLVILSQRVLSHRIE